MAYRRTERVIQRLAARHASIIDAARALASERGLDAVQIAPVAERAGIAAGTVYRYFPAKTDLVAALVATVSAQEFDAVKASGDAAPGPLSALAAAVVTFGARAVRERRLAWAMLGEPVEAEIGALRLEYRTGLAAEFEQRLQAAIDGGHVPEQDARQAAQALVGALIESLIGPLAPPHYEPAQARAAVQMMALFALRGAGVVDARARGIVVQTAMPVFVA